MVHTLLELQKHEHTTCPSLRDYAFNFSTFVSNSLTRVVLGLS